MTGILAGAVCFVGMADGQVVTEWVICGTGVDAAFHSPFMYDKRLVEVVIDPDAAAPTLKKENTARGDERVTLIFPDAETARKMIVFSPLDSQDQNISNSDGGIGALAGFALGGVVFG